MTKNTDSTITWLKLTDAVNEGRRVKIILNNIKMPDFLNTYYEIGDYTVSIKTQRKGRWYSYSKTDKGPVKPIISFKPVKTTKKYINAEDVKVELPEWTTDLFRLVIWKGLNKLTSCKKFYISKIESFEIV